MPALRAGLLQDGNRELDQRIGISGVGRFSLAFFYLAEGDAPLLAGEVIDNVVIETVPEPSTLGALLLGAAAAMARHTKR